MLINCLAACAHLTITVSEIERDIDIGATQERDRQTDGHRMPAIAALCIASHGKNRLEV